MPNKTIYVAEGDLAVFEEAQKIAGSNLSATIAQSLREFIKTKEAKDEGYNEISIKLGEDGTYTYKRFLGRELARSQSVNNDREVANVYIVYKTAKQHYALYTQEIHQAIKDLMRIETERILAEKYHIDIESEGSLWMVPNTYKLEVFQSIKELKNYIPDKLYNTLNQSQQSNNDFLDI